MNDLQIIEIPDFLSGEECRAFIQLSEEGGYEAAKVNLGTTERVMTGVRNNQRFFHTDLLLAERLWLKLKPQVPSSVGNSVAVGLNELFRFYRYTPGQRFKKHRDGSFVRDEFEASYFTFMVYLNDEFEGGSTTFADREVIPETGKALIFWHPLKHEGTAVVSGTKYVLRSDVMYRLSPE